MTTNERTAFPTTTGTSPRSCDRIFTCGEAQIATSPFVYRGVGIFMPEKVGNLQPFATTLTLGEASFSYWRFSPFGRLFLRRFEKPRHNIDYPHRHAVLCLLAVLMVGDQKKVLAVELSPDGEQR